MDITEGLFEWIGCFQLKDEGKELWYLFTFVFHGAWNLALCCSRLAYGRGGQRESPNLDVRCIRLLSALKVFGWGVACRLPGWKDRLIGVYGVCFPYK